MKGLSKGRYDETFTGEDGNIPEKCIHTEVDLLLESEWEEGNPNHKPREFK